MLPRHQRCLCTRPGCEFARDMERPLRLLLLTKAHKLRCSTGVTVPVVQGVYVQNKRWAGGRTSATGCWELLPGALLAMPRASAPATRKAAAACVFAQANVRSEGPGQAAVKKLPLQTHLEELLLLDEPGRM